MVSHYMYYFLISLVICACYIFTCRQHERQKKKERLRKARERGDVIGPGRKRLKHNTMALSSCKVQVVVDCSFDDLMSEKV